MSAEQMHVYNYVVLKCFFFFLIFSGYLLCHVSLNIIYIFVMSHFCVVLMAVKWSMSCVIWLSVFIDLCHIFVKCGWLCEMCDMWLSPVSQQACKHAGSCLIDWSDTVLCSARCFKIFNIHQCFILWKLLIAFSYLTSFKFISLVQNARTVLVKRIHIHVN